MLLQIFYYGCMVVQWLAVLPPSKKVWGLIPELTEGVLLCVSLNIDYVYFITVNCTLYYFLKYDLDYCMRHFQVNKIFAKQLLVVTPLVLFILMLFKRYIINLGWCGGTAGSIATSHFQVSGLILSLCYSLCGIFACFRLCVQCRFSGFLPSVKNTSVGELAMLNN